jgi:hypothetical protein
MVVVLMSHGGRNVFFYGRKGVGKLKCATKGPTENYFYCFTEDLGGSIID